MPTPWLFAVPEIELAAVADPGEETLAEVQARFHIKNGFRDDQLLLERAEVDAVVIATPTRTHADIVRRAATAGKHIFCEKPLSQTLSDCDLAIQAVKKAGVKLQMGFMRHFDPPYRTARAKIDAGEIGKPVMFKSISRDPRRTSLEFARRENSGGMIMDMGVHDFDLARWLMGSEVEQVSSEGGCLAYPELREVGDIDNALINLRFVNGAVGNIDLSRNAVYGYDIRTEVLGDRWQPVDRLFAADPHPAAQPPGSYPRYRPLLHGTFRPCLQRTNPGLCAPYFGQYLARGHRGRCARRHRHWNCSHPLFG